MLGYKQTTSRLSDDFLSNWTWLAHCCTATIPCKRRKKRTSRIQEEHEFVLSLCLTTFLQLVSHEQLRERRDLSVNLANLTRPEGNRLTRRRITSTITFQLETEQQTRLREESNSRKKSVENIKSSPTTVNTLLPLCAITYHSHCR